MGIKGIDNLVRDIVEFYSNGIDSITESAFGLYISLLKLFLTFYGNFQKNSR